MDLDKLLKEENISFIDNGIVVSKKKTLFSEIESVYIGEQNPSRERGFALIAIGVVLIIFTTRWFMAGGMVAILAGIVTFFDSRRKYCIIVKTKTDEKPIAASYDLNKIKTLEGAIKKKAAS